MSFKSFIFGCFIGSWVMYNKCRADVMKAAFDALNKDIESEDKE